ncbi:hypothetical protein [Fibrobacter sp.]|uniref:hypothetical protein n=1 Tax=Fibrobacter sp. TaxID=35828 RepID=UPI0025BA4732|nr:hypothetical protein [Fibrobacter sp.]MBR3073618.1 hypothetical protein [Fibrobacter sp.]
MRKIINGKMYNTETAKEVCVHNNGLDFSDFNYIIESLYKKKNGEFFKAGEGGPMTVYAHNCGNNTRCGGSKIIPLTIEEAKKFVEDYGSTDEYIKIFGEPEE